MDAMRDEETTPTRLATFKECLASASVGSLLIKLYYDCCPTVAQDESLVSRFSIHAIVEVFPPAGRTCKFYVFGLLEKFTYYCFQHLRMAKLFLATACIKYKISIRSFSFKWFNVRNVLYDSNFYEFHILPIMYSPPNFRGSFVSSASGVFI